MITDKMIRNARMLADEIGICYDDNTPLEELESSMSRAIYKGTNCGAWLALREIESAGKYEFWSIHLTKSIMGIHAIRARQRGRKTLPPHEVPDYVQQFCHITNPSNGLTSVTLEEWENLTSDADAATQGGVLRVTRINPIDKVVTFSVKNPSSAQGVAVGSIVEGCDYDTETQELAFPFFASEFWKAVNAVEEEASEIWDDTHGCDTCAAHWAEECGKTELDEVPVWTECPDCQGEGMVI